MARKGEKQTRPKSQHLNEKISLIKMTAKYTNSYLKQAHTKEVEKIGVNSYKVLLNFNDSAWNINKH